MTAPRGQGAMPLGRGERGSGRLRACSNRPSSANFFLSCSKASWSAPWPSGSSSSTMSWYSPRASKTSMRPRARGEADLRLAFPIAVRGAEVHGAHLRLSFLQSEVVVAAGGQFDAGYFAGDPDVGKFILQRRADGGVQLADGVDAAGGGEVEGELVHYLMLD